MSTRPSQQDLPIETRLAYAAEHLDEVSKEIDSDDGTQKELAQMIRGLEIIHDGFKGLPTESLTIEISA